MDAGVVDGGTALRLASVFGREASVKYLLEQKGGASSPRAYMNSRGSDGETLLICCLGFGLLPFCRPSRRVARLLIDAGADTSSKARITGRQGEVVFNETPAALATCYLRETKIAGGKDNTEEQLNKIEGIRRLLLRVEAVYAVSWRWPSGTPLIAGGGKGSGRDTAPPTPLISMLPTLRRRARSPRVLVAALFRWAPT